MFLYTKVVKSMIAGYEGVNQITDFWQFMENDLLDTVYWEEMYNTGKKHKDFPCPGFPEAKGPCPIPEDERMVMYANKMLGVPRIRQIRVRNDSCIVPENFKDVIKVRIILSICLYPLCTSTVPLNL